MTALLTSSVSRMMESRPTHFIMNFGTTIIPPSFSPFGAWAVSSLGHLPCAGLSVYIGKHREGGCLTNKSKVATVGRVNRDTGIQER